MKDWKKTLIAPDTPVLETMRVLDSSLLQVALVVDKGRKLIGTVTDGDIRRAILAGKSLDTSVAEIMNRSPKFCHQSDDRALIVHRLKSLHLHQMPILDERGVVVGLEIIDEILENGIKENWAMIMAGGLGSRLRPFTYEQPKPMLKVGEKPLLEIIIENLSAYGFRNFYISIHYKAEL
ncbi:MAG TPA: sugar phosphate nucleotidyltransferase, partial [Candidatus Glassbacteria bacterium]|nr:sugar phosphate nucleotidyltransferase [Candidatus Glassbacteria bacterium]